MRVVYKPYWNYVIEDVVALALSFFVVLEWFPLSTQIPFQKYGVFAAVFSVVWLGSAYMAHRYVRVKFQRIDTAILRLACAAALTFGVMLVYMYVIPPHRNYSIWVLLTIWIAMFAWTIAILIVSHAYMYATYEEPEPPRKLDRAPQKVLRPAKERDAQQQELIRQAIADIGQKIAKQGQDTAKHEIAHDHGVVARHNGRIE